MKKYFDKNVFKSKIIIFFSIIESFLQIYGYLLSNKKSLLDFGLKEIIILIILITFFIFINGILFMFMKMKIDKDDNKLFSKRRFFLVWFTLFVMWVPVLLAFYPSIFAYDAYRQVPHLLGQNLSSFQPVFHTLLIEFFLIVGNKLVNYEFGLLLYSLFQMLIMSFIFAYTIEKLIYMIKNKKIFYIILSLLIIFYGIIPFNSVFSISVTKDVLFSGFLLLFIVSFDAIIDNNCNNVDIILFIISSILIMLLKNSVVNTYLVTFLFAVILLKKFVKKKIFKLQVLSLLIYYVIYFTIVLIFTPEKNYKMEKYNVPMYNLVYTATKHSSVYDDKTLYGYFPRKCFYDDLNVYVANGHNADMSKESVIYCLNNSLDEKKLLSIWTNNLFKYPVEYIDSWSNLTLGSYYLLDTSHTNIYIPKRYMYTSFYRVEFMKDVNTDSKFKSMKKIINKFTQENIQYEKLSFLRFIFQPATYILSILLLFLYKIKNSSKDKLLIYIPLLCNLGAIIIGPCIIVRYIYPFMVSLPYLIIKNFIDNKAIQ